MTPQVSHDPSLAVRPVPGERMIKIGGVTLRVSCQGSGPPLLLINGLGANLDLWRPLRAALGDAATIAFDAPGAGRSSTPLVPLRMPALAGVVVGLLDRLGHDRVDVLGYSLGGALAQQLAHDAPERVNCLVLVATTAGAIAVPGHPRAALHLLSPLQYYSGGYLRRSLAGMVGGRTARDPRAVDRHAIDRLAAPPSFWGYQSQLSAMTGWTSAFWLSRLTQPTLVLTGDDDPLVPSGNARFLAGRIPGARLQVVPGAGHLLLVDQPEDVVDDIQAFRAAPGEDGP